MLFERADAPMDEAAASPETQSQWTARATSLLESVKVLPAQGSDLKLLVREMRNVLDCHETFTQEHGVSFHFIRWSWQRAGASLRELGPV